MKIEKNKVVALSYTLMVDGDIIETVKADKPMEFIFGTGYLLPKFEENIAGKVVGDPFKFTLTAAEGYGENNPDAIVELPVDMFKIDGKLEEGLLTVGNILPMQDSDGNRLQGSVEEVTEEVVVMNFNHPLAGSELNFSGSVVTVREATSTELMNGLFNEHASSGCSTDGCSTDGCDTCGCGGCGV